MQLPGDSSVRAQRALPDYAALQLPPTSGREPSTLVVRHGRVPKGLLVLSRGERSELPAGSMSSGVSSRPRGRGRRVTTELKARWVTGVFQTPAT